MSLASRLAYAPTRLNTILSSCLIIHSRVGEGVIVMDFSLSFFSGSCFSLYRIKFLGVVFDASHVMCLQRLFLASRDPVGIPVGNRETCLEWYHFCCLVSGLSASMVGIPCSTVDCSRPLCLCCSMEYSVSSSRGKDVYLSHCDISLLTA